MTKDDALKLALEALEGADWYINQLEMIVYSVDDDGTHENRLKVQQALTKIKEALAQPEQSAEPVVLDVTIDDQKALEMLRDMVVQEDDDELMSIRLIAGNGQSGYGLYVLAAQYPDEGAMLLANTTPPKREWVGLTNADWNSTFSILFDMKFRAGAEWAEAKLKEKNS